MNKLQAAVQFAFAVFAKASTFVYQAKERSNTHRFGITVKVCVAAFGDLYLCPPKLFTACARGCLYSVHLPGQRILQIAGTAFKILECVIAVSGVSWGSMRAEQRSEEHTSELQSPDHLV